MRSPVCLVANGVDRGSHVGAPTGGRRRRRLLRRLQPLRVRRDGDRDVVFVRHAPIHRSGLRCTVRKWCTPRLGGHAAAEGFARPSLEWDRCSEAQSDAYVRSARYAAGLWAEGSRVPGADVKVSEGVLRVWAGVSPVLMQMWAGVSPVMMQMWAGVSPVLMQMCAAAAARRHCCGRQGAAVFVRMPLACRDRRACLPRSSVACSGDSGHVPCLDRHTHTNKQIDQNQTNPAQRRPHWRSFDSAAHRRTGPQHAEQQPPCGYADVAVRCSRRCVARVARLLHRRNAVRRLVVLVATCGRICRRRRQPSACPAAKAEARPRRGRARNTTWLHPGLSKPSA